MSCLLVWIFKYWRINCEVILRFEEKNKIFFDFVPMK